MSKVRDRDSKAELKVRSLLHKLGYRYRLHRTDLPGTPDIVLPKYRAIVFVHGCFWHQHQGCSRSKLPKSNKDFWRGKLEKNVARDKKNRNTLREKGWNVLYVWECETKKSNISGIEQKFREILK